MTLTQSKHLIVIIPSCATLLVNLPIQFKDVLVIDHALVQFYLTLGNITLYVAHVHFIQALQVVSLMIKTSFM
jgi:hypothetical protein